MILFYHPVTHTQLIRLTLYSEEEEAENYHDKTAIKPKGKKVPEAKDG